MSNSLLGKKFICGVSMFLIASATVCVIKCPPDIYLKMVEIIVGAFFVSQTITDVVSQKKG
jgi:hypothetical protein